MGAGKPSAMLPPPEEVHFASWQLRCGPCTKSGKASPYSSEAKIDSMLDLSDVTPSATPASVQKAQEAAASAAAKAAAMPDSEAPREPCPAAALGAPGEGAPVAAARGGDGAHAAEDAAEDASTKDSAKSSAKVATERRQLPSGVDDAPTVPERSTSIQIATPQGFPGARSGSKAGSDNGSDYTHVTSPSGSVVSTPRLYSKLSVDSTASSNPDYIPASSSTAGAPRPRSSFRGSKKHDHRRLLITHTMGMEPSSALTLVIENAGDIKMHYKLHDGVLGKGAFGVVRRAELHATRAVRAVKALLKDQMKETRHLIKAEIEIMKMIDHPNVVMLYEVFEDELNLFLVLEMCTGGSLEDRLKAQGGVKEPAAAVVMQQILRAVYYLHKHLIIHRDMKADNCLLSSSAGFREGCLVKVSDFGLSCVLEEGKLLKKTAGTPTHMAPEVISKKYRHNADVWSCGVIAFNVISGCLPFTGYSSDDVKSKITNGRVSFASSEWLDVKQDCCEFILGMLTRSPTRRGGADKALKSAWMLKHIPEKDKVNCPPRIIRDLRTFRRRNKIKRAALHVMASMLADSAVNNVRKLFMALDADGDGKFSVDELRKLMRGEGIDHRFEKDVFEEQDGTMHDFSYTEFLAATFDRKKSMTPALAKAAFTSFDKNGDGQVSVRELSTGKVLGRLPLEEVTDALEEVDQDGDGDLNYEEFVKMMETSRNPGEASAPSRAEEASAPAARPSQKKANVAKAAAAKASDGTAAADKPNAVASAAAADAKPAEGAKQRAAPAPKKKTSGGGERRAAERRG